MKDLTTVIPLQRKVRGIGRELTHINDMVGHVFQQYQDVIDRFHVERKSWNKDKIHSMKGMEYGKEEASSAKLLNKHRTMEYSSIVQKISAAASEPANIDKLDTKPIIFFYLQLLFTQKVIVKSLIPLNYNRSSEIL